MAPRNMTKLTVLYGVLPLAVGGSGLALIIAADYRRGLPKRFTEEVEVLLQCMLCCECFLT